MLLITMCSFLNNLFTVIGNNNPVKIGLVTELFILNYQSLFFQINSITLIESGEFRETSNVTIMVYVCLPV